MLRNYSESDIFAKKKVSLPLAHIYSSALFVNKSQKMYPF